MFNFDVNYLAVIVSAILSMILGFLWYGPLFGKAWMKYMGWGNLSKEDIKKKQQEAKPAYITSFIGALLAAFVISVLTLTMYIQSAGGAVLLALLLWVGIIAPVQLSAVMYEGKPKGLWKIDTLYHLVLLVIIALIVVYWQ